MELELNGKVALVTGAIRGIGAAIAAEFAREGINLYLVARDSTSLRRLPIPSADLRDPAAPDQAIADAVEHFGRLDPVVNNARPAKRADFLTVTEEDWQGVRPKVSRLCENDSGGMAAFG